MSPKELQNAGWNLLAVSQDGNGIVVSFIAKRGRSGTKFYGRYSYKTKQYTIQNKWN